MSERLQILIIFTFAISCCNVQGNARNRIVGGKIVSIRDYPYLVSIRREGKHHCGGSIIHESAVITAAHCLNKLIRCKTSTWKIHAGTSISSEKGQVHNILWLAQHENYQTGQTQDDIAIIKIVDTFIWEPNIQLIPLYEKAHVPAGTMATVAGWGARDYRETFQIRPLSSVEVPIISNKDCNKAYKNIQKIYDTNVCAAYKEGGKDACQGDSGGPLVIDNTIAGVISWGIGCASSKYPGVYTLLYPYHAWIEATISINITANIEGEPTFL